MHIARSYRRVVAIGLLLTIGSTAAGKYSGGNGTVDDPYQIATAADLIKLGETPDDYDKHFILTADIDLDPNLPGRMVFDKAAIAPDTNDAESGFQGTPFSGVVDGNGRRISHLTVSGESYLGLFGQLASSAQVTNVNMVDVGITGSGDYVGGLVGRNLGALIECVSKGNVAGRETVGGLVGRNHGALSGCASGGAIGGNSYVGGLVGIHGKGEVAECYSNGTVEGDQHVGALVGCNLALVSRSHSDGVVSAIEHVGGLAGSSHGEVTQCFSRGSVEGSSSVGGLAGLNQDGDINNCYSTGTVRGSSRVGGLVGSNEGNITMSYSAGAVTGEVGIGGLVGVNSASPDAVADSFWDTQTAGSDRSDGGTGKTTVEMQTANTFRAWEPCIGEPIWTIDEGRDYPRLWWEQRPGEPIEPMSLSDSLSGTGTEDDPYLILTAEELNLIGSAKCDWDRHFRLMADIDLSDFSYSTALIAPDTSETGDGFQGVAFSGVFDGNGHTISHLTISGGSYLGLFGRLADGATVSNLGLELVDVNGTGLRVGGLAGQSRGHVSECYSTGSVSGDRSVGGLVGDNSSWVTDCHSAASVSGRMVVGGLVGSNDGGRVTASSSAGTTDGDFRVGGLIGYSSSGVVTDCYNAGTVSGTETVGGCIGDHSGSLAQCYNSGAVSGNYTVGGLVGHSDDFGRSSSVTACYNTAAVSGDEGPVGGLVGVLMGRYSVMTECYNSGVISGSYTVGGVVGYSEDATMIRCYSTGAVTGRDRVGGLVGVMGKLFGGATARRCFSTADVRGEAEVGGLAGSSIGVIEDCYAIATVAGERDVGGLLGRNGSAGGSPGAVSKCFSASHVSGAQNVKGLVGSNEQGNITASFWDIESSGLPGRPTEGAKTTTQMQQATTFLEAGWDFVDETENGVLNIWWIEEGRDYPRFWWHSGRTPYSGGGTGEPNDPYQIATAEDLTLLGETPGDYHKHFILTADIDLDPNLPGGKIFDTAVIAPDWTLTTMSGFQGRPFTGVFDGNGHKISHITIDDASYLGYLGLFGQLGPGAEVSNLGLEAVAINGAGDYIGGFAGESDGRIASSYCTGTISGTGSYVGGLVGSNRGYITASYSTCTISGRWHVGGLASENDGRIATSYSTGTISGWTHVGGLIGSDGGTISSFWDIETSGQTTSDGGTGKTTAEMQTATTFLEAGWDFMDETENGTDDIWWIVEGQDYPRLWWEEVLVLMVDDFESYTDDIDAGEAIFETWVVYGDHVAHVGHLLPPFAEQTIVHGGSQSMPFYYDNTGGVVNSRAERWWGPARDWTIDDADALTLYFRGEADNDPEPLYVAIEDDAGQIAVVTHPGADAVQATEWQKWHIPLAELQAAGVDVAAVEKMIIGVGEREKLQPGGEGLLYIDDILLTNRMR